MKARTHLDPLAIGLMVALCAIWGVQQVAIKWALPGISPVTQSALRSLGAAILVGAWAASRGVRLFERDGTLAAGIAAAMLFAGEFALIYWALQFTTASRGVIFLYTAPFIVSVGAVRLIPGEHLRPGQWAGLACAFAGVLVLFGENLLRPAGRAWVGDLMMLGAAVAWAATTLVIKATALARAAPEKTLLYQLAGSAVVLPLAAWALDEPGVVRLTPAVVGSLAFQVCVVASASYLGWFWLVKHYPATRLSAFSFMTPVFGVIAGVLLMGDPLNWAVFLALALVAAGIAAVNRPPPASPR